MARVDQAPEDRDGVLVLEGLVECPRCDTTQEVLFTCPPDVTEREDLIDPPEAETICGNCGHEWRATYGGWTAYQDA